MIEIERRRVKGWKMPPNTVYVGRPTLFGNPFASNSKTQDVKDFRSWLIGEGFRNFEQDRRRKLVMSLFQLKGKNLACWCKLGSPCHRRVLLDVANNPLAMNEIDKGEKMTDGIPESEQCEANGCDQYAEFEDPMGNKLCSDCIQADVETGEYAWDDCIQIPEKKTKQPPITWAKIKRILLDGYGNEDDAFQIAIGHFDDNDMALSGADMAKFNTAIVVTVGDLKQMQNA